MNAIVGLCHFCEAHGPRPIFCTFTTDDEGHITESSNSSGQCNGCRSLGAETVYVSRDEDGTIYCSRESVPNPDVTSFLRQAAIRSITCEVNWSKEGGVVYFSDTRFHVLSFTFQLKDTRARGLKRWFSIVVLMKDKMLLLSTSPMLSDNMQEVAKELQDLAESVFDAEQKVCSQRVLRLNTGCNNFGQSRSLAQLTGEEEVFKRLHSHFTWMLRSGALTYKEKLYTSQEVLNKLNPHRTEEFSIFSENACDVPSSDVCMPLRSLENLLSKSVFRIILYCTLTGVNVMIKSTKIPPVHIMKGLSRLLPVAGSDPLPHMSIDDQNVTSSASNCVLENSGDIFTCRWPGTLPKKSSIQSDLFKMDSATRSDIGSTYRADLARNSEAAECEAISILLKKSVGSSLDILTDVDENSTGPTLMNRIENAMCNSKFEEAVLHQHVKSLQLEWLGIARAIKSATEASGASSEPVVKLKQALGVTPQDELLVKYWISAFCT